jgi:hypothetical protein
MIGRSLNAGMDTTYSYQVIDSQTNEVVGTYGTLRRARREADRLDLEYGAIRYRVRQMYCVIAGQSEEICICGAPAKNGVCSVTDCVANHAKKGDL